jgi:hypothetical protein
VNGEWRFRFYWRNFNGKNDLRIDNEEENEREQMKGKNNQWIF